jgi:hypothetical protein
MYDLSSFSHGQIISKIWLCEELEKYCKFNDNLYILGGWHNVLGFMMSIRKPNFFKRIHNIDINSEVIEFADKICDTWINVLHATNSHIINTCADSNEYNLQVNTETDIIINCSVEHFNSSEWFNKLPSGTLVCIQSTDIKNEEVINSTELWKQGQSNKDLSTFLNRFPVSEYLYVGTKTFEYPNYGYNRFMMIGRK